MGPSEDNLDFLLAVDERLGKQFWAMSKNKRVAMFLDAHESNRERQWGQQNMGDANLLHIDVVRIRTARRLFWAALLDVHKECPEQVEQFFRSRKLHHAVRKVFSAVERADVPRWAHQLLLKGRVSRVWGPSLRSGAVRVGQNTWKRKRKRKPKRWRPAQHMGAAPARANVADEDVDMVDNDKKDAMAPFDVPPPPSSTSGRSPPCRPSTCSRRPPTSTSGRSPPRTSCRRCRSPNPQACSPR